MIVRNFVGFFYVTVKKVCVRPFLCNCKKIKIFSFESISYFKNFKNSFAIWKVYKHPYKSFIVGTISACSLDFLLVIKK